MGCPFLYGEEMDCTLQWAKDYKQKESIQLKHKNCSKCFADLK